MKLKFILFVIAAIPTICMAGFQSGNELKVICANTADSFSRGQCLGYVTGVFDEAAAAKQICPLSNVTAQQVEDITKKYFNQYPEYLHYSANSLIVTAMIKAFPCSGKR
jgi:hypothetical protein